MLTEMKKISIYRTNKDSFNKTIEFYGTTYNLATGGIHSQDPPRILRSKKVLILMYIGIILRITQVL